MKKLLLGLAVAGVLLAGFFLIGKIIRKPSEVKINNEISQNPWVEVLQGEIAELSGNGELIRSLKSGDEARIGNFIETKPDSFANVYFPDGSVARLSDKTKLLIESSKFDEKTEKLDVRLKLLAGKLWSKVLGLATQDSVWEVRTSNAVATVRGTAFGVEVLNGESKIVGAEHKIEVTPIDKKTGKLIQEAKVEVSENKFVEIKDEAVAAAMAGTKQQASKAIVAAIVVKDVTREILSENWVKRALAADMDLNKKINQVKKAGFDDKNVRKVMKDTIREFRKEVKESKKEAINGAKEQFNRKTLPQVFEEKLKNKIEQRILEEKQPEIKAIPLEEKLNLEIRLEPAAGSVAPAIIKETSVLVKPETLIISSDRDLKIINEGDTILFRAVLVLSDGTKRDVTDSALWKVIGPIGGIAKPGVFSAKLSLEISEAGEGSGVITAIWKDPQTGEAFLGKTQIFKVEFNVPVILDPTRG